MEKQQKTIALGGLKGGHRRAVTHQDDDLCENFLDLWCPEPESNQRHADFQAIHRRGKSTGCAAVSCQTPYGKSST